MQLNNNIIFLFPYCWRQSPKCSFIIRTGAHNNDYNIMPPVLECKWVTFTILGALLMGVKLGIKDCCALFKNSTLFVTPHWSLYFFHYMYIYTCKWFKLRYECEWENCSGLTLSSSCFSFRSILGPLIWFHRFFIFHTWEKRFNQNSNYKFQKIVLVESNFSGTHFFKSVGRNESVVDGSSSIHIDISVHPFNLIILFFFNLIQI